MCPRLTGRVLVCIHYLGVIIKHTCLDNKLLWCVYMYIFMYMCAIVCSCMYVWVCVYVYMNVHVQGNSFSSISIDLTYSLALGDKHYILQQGLP